MKVSCSYCPAYNKGKGSKYCLKCPQFRDILPKYSPGPSIDNMPAEIVENLPTLMINDNILKAMQAIDTRQATVLIQYTSLNMTQKEIGEYHGISQPRVIKIISQATENIRKILAKGYN